MSADLTRTSVPPATPKLRVARLEDSDLIRRLEMAHFGTTQPLDEWRSLWLENPLWPRLSDRWPIGWLLEDHAGCVVGSLLNIPTLYHFRGRELINATGRAWAVETAFRGYAMWLLDEYYHQPGVDLFVNNTINRLAEESHHGYATRIPLGEWDIVSYWVTGYRGFAREVLQRLRIPLPAMLSAPAAACLWLRDALRGKRLPAATRGVDFEAVSQFDSRFDDFWQQLVRQYPGKLLAARDTKTLTWHYATLQRRGRLWVYTAARNGQLRAYCVLKRQGGSDPIRRMRLVDYQTLEGDAGLLAGMLRAALKRCVEENMYVLEHLGLGLPGLETLDRCAPYRRKWPHWPYYFHAVDPAIAAELRLPDAWNPSMYDGDGSFE
jgi:hypothetical protein